MLERCKFFVCGDTAGCKVFQVGNCFGKGGEAYIKCGCDSCKEQTQCGSIEICEVGIILKEKDMEE